MTDKRDREWTINMLAVLKKGQAAGIWTDIKPSNIIPWMHTFTMGSNVSDFDYLTDSEVEQQQKNALFNANEDYLVQTERLEAIKRFQKFADDAEEQAAELANLKEDVLQAIDNLYLRGVNWSDMESQLTKTKLSTEVIRDLIADATVFQELKEEMEKQ